MVSGSQLKPGEMAIRYARAQGGVAEATVLATDIVTSAVNAALVNGMFAHADETDDFDPVNPMDTESVNHKARLLMAAVLGDVRTEEVMRHVNALEELSDVHALRPFLAHTRR